MMKCLINNDFFTPSKAELSHSIELLHLNIDPLKDNECAEKYIDSINSIKSFISEQSYKLQDYICQIEEFHNRMISLCYKIYAANISTVDREFLNYPIEKYLDVTFSDVVIFMYYILLGEDDENTRILLNVLKNSSDNIEINRISAISIYEFIIELKDIAK